MFLDLYPHFQVLMPIALFQRGAFVLIQPDMQIVLILPHGAPFSARRRHIGDRVLPASCLLVPKRYACARRRGLRCFATTFYAAHQKVISHPLRRSSFPKCKQFLGLHFGFLFSRYNSRYGIPKDWFLPFVVATLVAMQRSIPIPAAFWQDPRTRP